MKKKNHLTKNTQQCVWAMYYIRKKYLYVTITENYIRKSKKKNNTWKIFAFHWFVNITNNFKLDMNNYTHNRK